MNKILVTGGCGFLGMHLINMLLESGASVRCLDIKLPEISHPQFEYMVGSFTDKKILQDALADCNTVFHLASTTIPKDSNDDPLFDIETNLLGTIKFLDYVVNSSVSKFIFISSGGTVYGNPKEVPVSEEQSTNPNCSYGIVKLAIEKYLLMYHQLYGLGACILRISNPYGEGQRIDRAQGAVTHFCHKALAGETCEIWGDGTIVRDYIYVKDAVRAMMCAMDKDCAGKIINIGCGTGVSLNEILSLIESICGFEVKRQYLPRRDFDVQRTFLDIGRATEILGWEPKVPLEDGVAAFIKSITIE